ncbi:MAG: sensor histidine kinase [Bacteroidales bacterium]
MRNTILKNTFNKIVATILGSSKNFSLEHRFLNFISLAICIGLLIALPINLYADFEARIFYPNLVFFIIFTFLFYNTRILKKFLPTVWLSYIIFIVLSVALWIAEGGTSSPTLYTFIAHLAIFMWIFPPKSKFPAFFLLFIIISAMFYIEIAHPNWITINPDKNQTPIDQYAIFAIVFIIIFLFNIYTRKNYNMEKQKAQRSDKLKSAFIANLSHEVRTPLNAIMGFTELIADETTPQKEKDEFKQLIKQSSKSLLTLLTDMIELSRMEAGDYHPVFKSCNPKSILEKIIEEMELYLTQVNRTNLKINTDIQFSEDIISDSFALQQIGKNIISNAIKFTHEGEIYITLLHKKNHLLLEIKDTGIGMTKDAKKLIFDSFRQVDESSTRSYGGIGLGLSLTKGFVDALGGRIKVKSKLDKGSSFIISIPTSIPN